MSFSSTPTFKPQAPDSQISEIALRILVEFPNSETHVIGTATVISGFLAITAKHVLEDIVSRFGTAEIEQNRHEIREYAVRLYQILPGPEYAIWNIVNAWTCPETDIAILQLGLHGYTAPHPPSSWKQPPLRATPPPIGSAIVGFGYRNSVVETTPNDCGYHLDLNDEPIASTGEVEDILPEGNPAGRFSFPCFRVNARFDGGMSGGPVIDTAGNVCGIVSGTYGDSGDGHLSYAVSLWPMFRTLISGNRQGDYPRDVEYPMIDLVLDGQIFATGFRGLDPALFPGRDLPDR